jgi:hypothetical protein
MQLQLVTQEDDVTTQQSLPFQLHWFASMKGLSKLFA